MRERGLWTERKTKGERKRERFGGKQRETTGTAGREFISSADYQSKSAFVYAS